MNLDKPLQADIVRAIGITKLQYEPTMGYRFLAGTETGMVINISRKVTNSIDKLTIRFRCHVGPVIAIDRNPFATKYFLTVGDWTVKIWAEESREGSLTTIRLDPLNSIVLNRAALRIRARNLLNLKSLGSSAL